MADPWAGGLEPTGRVRFKEMLPTLVLDVAVPILVFNLFTRYGVATLWALAAGGLSPVVNNIRVWVRARQVEPLGMIVRSEQGKQATKICAWRTTPLSMTLSVMPA